MMLSLTLLTVLAAPAAGGTFVSSSDKQIELRLIAIQPDDRVLLNTTDESDDGVLARDGRPLSKWVPVDRSSPANTHVELLANAITRTTDSGTEVLVLLRAEDISSSDIASIAALEPSKAGQQRVNITIDDPAVEEFYRFTLENRHRNMAVIVDGKIRAVPAIFAPVHKDIVLTPTRVDKVRVEQ